MGALCTKVSMCSDKTSPNLENNCEPLLGSEPLLGKKHHQTEDISKDTEGRLTSTKNQGQSEEAQRMDENSKKNRNDYECKNYTFAAPNPSKGNFNIFPINDTDVLKKILGPNGYVKNMRVIAYSYEGYSENGKNLNEWDDTETVVTSIPSDSGDEETLSLWRSLLPTTWSAQVGYRDKTGWVTPTQIYRNSSVNLPCLLCNGFNMTTLLWMQLKYHKWDISGNKDEFDNSRDVGNYVG